MVEQGTHGQSIVGAVHATAIRADSVHGGINVGAPGNARSRYAERVDEIAAREPLQDRDNELRLLRAHCQEPVACPYLVWRAPAWAGKTALLAAFVLSPPAHTRIFSFFVGRFAGHDNRDGFLHVLLEQLADFLERPLPQSLSPYTQEAHFLGMLSDAVEKCTEMGDRAVLVVDGLDEDRGVTTDPGAHSIAALLPSTPPGDLRVIVSTRPNPTTPGDVPDLHPLRRRRDIHDLLPSRRAQVVRRDMERELDRLLCGTDQERELLGLLTAARSGLTVSDLVELTGWSHRTTTKLLDSVAGRTFMPRSVRGNKAYILGHEALQASAEDFIGAAALTGYFHCLQTWADRYREAEWPDSTPDYLAEGYPRLLMETNDVDRLVCLATDQFRHEWLHRIAVSAAALADINLAKALVNDLPRMARLALHTGLLLERRDQIPPELAGLWLAVGRRDHADNLLAGFDTPLLRAEALASMITVAPELDAVNEVVSICARSLGPYDQARLLSHVTGVIRRCDTLPRAMWVCRSIQHDNLRLPVVLELIEHAMRTGQAQYVEGLLSRLPLSGEGRRAGLALATTSTDPARAEAMCEQITSSSLRAEALVAIARIHAARDERRLAHTIILRVVGDQDDERSSATHVKILISATGILCAIGLTDQARDLAEELAKFLDSSISSDPLAVDVAAELSAVLTAAPELRNWMRPVVTALCAHPPWSVDLVRLVAEVKSVDEAWTLVDTGLDHARRLSAIIAVVEVACRNVAADQAAALVEELEQAITAVAHPAGPAGFLATVVAGLAKPPTVTGQSRPNELYSLVCATVRTFPGADALPAELLSQRSNAWLPTLIKAILAVGGPGWMVRLLEQVGVLSGFILRTATIGVLAESCADRQFALRLLAEARNLYDRTPGLPSDRHVVDLVVAANRLDPVEALLASRQIVSTATRMDTLAHLGDLRKRAGVEDFSALLAETDDLMAKTLSPVEVDDVRYGKVRLEATAGLFSEGEATAAQIDDPFTRGRATVALMRAAARAGDDRRARHFLHLGVTAAHLAAGSAGRGRVIAVVAQGARDVGWYDDAMNLVDRIDDSYDRAAALVDLARTASADHRHELLMAALRCGHLDVVAPAFMDDPEVSVAILDEVARVSSRSADA
ncbi:hypothetical protein [Actinokineospora enzanensis]|uniref:hypothetical protein n=1 Tax=Actinokineospora enzanensis TaxID=155975 RepID=UPI0003A6BC74|nr:hypothetical protein [Actinokineospora enzanensis]